MLEPTLPNIHLKGHKGAVVKALFSHNNKYIASGSNANEDNLIIWQNITGGLLHNLPGHAKDISALAFSYDDEQLISGSNNKKNNLKTWNTETGNLEHELVYHDNWITAVDCNNNGMIVSASNGDNNNLALWDKNGVLLYGLTGYTSGVDMVQFSSDGQTFASSNPSWYDGQRQTLIIWNVNGEKIRTLCFNDVNIDLALNNDLTQYAASRPVSNIFPENGPTGNTILTIWKTDGTSQHTKWPENVFVGHPDEIWCATFSPSSSKIASGTISYKNILLLWDNLTGNILHNLMINKNRTDSAVIYTIAFDKDEKIVVSGSSCTQGNLCVWNVETGLLSYNLKGHKDSVFSVSFSPDNKFMISAGGEYNNNKPNNELFGELILWFLDQSHQADQPVSANYNLQ